MRPTGQNIWHLSVLEKGGNIEEALPSVPAELVYFLLLQSFDHSLCLGQSPLGH